MLMPSWRNPAGLFRYGKFHLMLFMVGYLHRFMVSLMWLSFHTACEENIWKPFRWWGQSNSTSTHTSKGFLLCCHVFIKTRYCKWESMSEDLRCFHHATYMDPFWSTVSVTFIEIQILLSPVSHFKILENLINFRQSSTWTHTCTRHPTWVHVTNPEYQHVIDVW